MIIWLASYPKSGNTWVRSFLTAYYFSEDGTFDVNKLNLIPDYPNKQFFDKEIKEGEIHNHWEESQNKIVSEKKIKFLKTHNSLIKAFDKEFTSPKHTLGVIYIIRDPRNVITSIKNHNDFSNYQQALDFMTNENAIISDYEHLQNHAKTNIINSWKINYKSWLSDNRFRRIDLKYEDLLINPFQTFRDLVVFVNTICRFNLRVDDKKLINAINSTSFKELQKIENSGNFKENVYSNDNVNKKNFFILDLKMIGKKN